MQKSEGSVVLNTTASKATAVRKVTGKVVPVGKLRSGHYNSICMLFVEKNIDLPRGQISMISHSGGYFSLGFLSST